MKFLILAAVAIGGIFAIDPLPIDGNGRIIGGSDISSTLNSPFMAAVYHAGPGFLCGGVIVDLNWILTTADCVYAYSFEDPVQVYAEVGGVKLDTVEAGKHALVLDRIVIHPEFHSREMIYYNNLALMKTKWKIIVSQNIAPITLPSTEAVVPGTSTNLAGWGGSSNASPATNLQLSSENVILDHKECLRLSGMIIDREFCTDPKVSASACKYDHGSPLYRFDPVLGSVLLGTVNYAPCTTTNFPTIYTSIPDYVNWILTTIN